MPAGMVTVAVDDVRVGGGVPGFVGGQRALCTAAARDGAAWARGAPTASRLAKRIESRGCCVLYSW